MWSAGAQRWVRISSASWFQPVLRRPIANRPAPPTRDWPAPHPFTEHSLASLASGTTRTKSTKVLVRDLRESPRMRTARPVAQRLVEAGHREIHPEAHPVDPALRDHLALSLATSALLKNVQATCAIRSAAMGSRLAKSSVTTATSKTATAARTIATSNARRTATVRAISV